MSEAESPTEDNSNEEEALAQEPSDVTPSRLRTYLPILLVLLGLLLFQNLRPTEYDEFVGQQFDFSGLSYQGERVTSASLKGSVVVINFWATYCPYCLEDIEHLKELNEELRHDDFQIVGVSSDQHSALEEFFEQRPRLPWPTWYGADAFQLGTDYKVHDIPRVMLLDQSGKIVAVARGIDDIKAQVYHLVHNG